MAGVCVQVLWRTGIVVQMHGMVCMVMVIRILDMHRHVRQFTGTLGQDDRAQHRD